MLALGDAVFVTGRARSMFIWGLTRRRVYVADNRWCLRALAGYNDGTWTPSGLVCYPRVFVSRIENGKGEVRYHGTCTFTLLSPTTLE